MVQDEALYTTASWHRAPPEMVIRNVKRLKRPHRLGHLVGTLFTLFGAGRAKEISLLSTPPPPPAGGVGGYNHRDSGEEGEWRPLFLCANP